MPRGKIFALPWEKSIAARSRMYTCTARWMPMVRPAFPGLPWVVKTTLHPARQPMMKRMKYASTHPPRPQNTRPGSQCHTCHPSPCRLLKNGRLRWTPRPPRLTYRVQYHRSRHPPQHLEGAAGRHCTRWFTAQPPSPPALPRQCGLLAHWHGWPWPPAHSGGRWPHPHNRPARQSRAVCRF